tara:strand:+ start:25358 stop:25540 length:183 start_codon:yes stop_codon:yes gene_type:complete
MKFLNIFKRKWKLFVDKHSEDIKAKDRRNIINGCAKAINNYGEESINILDEISIKVLSKT